MSMAAVALAISAGGALSSLQTTALLTVEETLAALEKAGSISTSRPAANRDDGRLLVTTNVRRRVRPQEPNLALVPKDEYGRRLSRLAGRSVRASRPAVRRGGRASCSLSSVLCFSAPSAWDRLLRAVKHGNGVTTLTDGK